MAIKNHSFSTIIFLLATTSAGLPALAQDMNSPSPPGSIQPFQNLNYQQPGNLPPSQNPNYNFGPSSQTYENNNYPATVNGQGFVNQNPNYPAQNYTQPYQNPGIQSQNTPQLYANPLGYPAQGNAQPYQNQSYPPPQDYSQQYQNPGVQSQNTPQLYANPLGYPAQGNAQPYQNQSYQPPQDYSQQYQNPGVQSQNTPQLYANPLGYPAQSSTGTYQNPGYPPQNNQPAYPNPGFQAQNTTQPSQNPAYPAPTGNVPANNQARYALPPDAAPTAHNRAVVLINQAYDLAHAGNNEQAIELLKQAIAIDPASFDAHMNMSAALIALKRYDEALSECTIALKLNPKDEKVYANYLGAAIGSNHLDDALRVGQDYLKRFPHGEVHTVMANEVTAVKAEMKNRENIRGVMAPPGAPDNYLYLVTPTGKRHWAPQAMPLKVYIAPGQGYQGFLPDFQNILINSFMAWQNATHGLVRFMPVDDPHVANIECGWADSAYNLSLGAEAGEAVVHGDPGSISHVNITILTRRPELPDKKISLPLVQQVSLHEIGHALGLGGHSDNAQDIMFCATDSNVEHVQLSQRDINTLILLYQ